MLSIVHVHPPQIFCWQLGEQPETCCEPSSKPTQFGMLLPRTAFQRSMPLSSASHLGPLACRLQPGTLLHVLPRPSEILEESWAPVPFSWNWSLQDHPLRLDKCTSRQLTLPIKVELLVQSQAHTLNGFTGFPSC